MVVLRSRIGPSFNPHRIEYFVKTTTVAARVNFVYISILDNVYLMMPCIKLSNSKCDNLCKRQNTVTKLIFGI